MIFVDLAVIAENANLLLQFEIVGDDRARLAKCAEILSRIKAEAARVAEGAGTAVPCIRRRGPEQASSITTRPCARAISRIGSMSAGWPKGGRE